MVGWLVGGCMVWLFSWWVGRSVGGSIGQSWVGWLVCGFIGWVRWLVGRWVGKSVGGPIGQCVGW